MEAGLLTPTYNSGRSLMGLRAKALGYEIQVKGQENVPSEEPVLFGPSHRNKEDPWLLGFSATSRPVFCMAKEELWTSQYLYLGYLLNLVGAFPVNRNNPGHSTIRTARKHLSKGRAVGIFAEGSRYEDEVNEIVRGPEIGFLHRTIGRLAILEKASIVPVGIGLARKPSGWRDSKIVRIVIPPAIYPDLELSKKDAEKQIMEDFAISLQSVFTEASNAAASETTFS